MRKSMGTIFKRTPSGVTKMSGRAGARIRATCFPLPPRQGIFHYILWQCGPFWTQHLPLTCKIRIISISQHLFISVITHYFLVCALNNLGHSLLSPSLHNNESNELCEYSSSFFKKMKYNYIIFSLPFLPPNSFSVPLLCPSWTHGLFFFV